MKKLLIFILSLLFIFPYFAMMVSAEEDTVATVGGYYDIDAPEYEPRIALLVNSDTDTVIYAKNADVVTAPASLTKIVTGLVALSKCNDLQTQITCSQAAIESLWGTGSSVIGLVGGETTTFEMLLYCLFLPSANDAAAVLAEYFGDGDPQKFVDEMNKYAKSLGCTNTHFANPHGLDDTSIEGYDSDTQNRTTAYDMYLIAKAALQNETIVKISSTYGKTMPANNMSGEKYLYNTNPLLNSYSPYYYEGTIGLKTGTTDKAGGCLITSATKDGYTYIAIAMGGALDYYVDGTPYNTSYLMCRYMLDWAFDNVKMKILADTSYILGEVKVEYGRGADYVALVSQDKISSVVHEDIDISDMTVVFADDFPASVKAPVTKGDVVGKAYLMYGDIKIADITLVTQQDVKRNHLWASFNWLEKIVKSKVFIVIVIIIFIVIIILLITRGNRKMKRERKRGRVDIVKDYSKLAK